jgi:hypothetical protein
VKRLALPAIFALSACAAPAPRYAAFDPLSGNPAPSAQKRGEEVLYTGVVPKGYARTEGRLSAPVVEFIRREVYDGEASITIERYREEDGAPAVDAYAKSLHPTSPAPASREIDGKAYAVYHDLRFESYARRIPLGDPYADALGTKIRQPKLDPTGKRRFPKGGDAYRLHRCKKVGAWGILADQTRARVGLEKGDPEPKPMKPRERGILATCFGRVVVERLRRGEPYGNIPKPSLSRLRLMAKDEWEKGAARRVERECVHLRKTRDGFAVVRFRTPDHAFEDQHAAWELFLSALTIPKELP